MSSNISKLLQTDAFTYSVAGFAAIHRISAMPWYVLTIVMYKMESMQSHYSWCASSATC